MWEAIIDTLLDNLDLPYDKYFRNRSNMRVCEVGGVLFSFIQIQTYSRGKQL